MAVDNSSLQSYKVRFLFQGASMQSVTRIWVIGLCLVAAVAGFFQVKPVQAKSTEEQSAQGQKRSITEKDIFQFNWIGDPQISPDGSRVAFVKVTVNDKKDGYDTAIWSVPMLCDEA